jgi:hypothetical protein
MEHHTFACSNLAALLERLRLLGFATAADANPDFGGERSRL